MSAGRGVVEVGECIMEVVVHPEGGPGGSLKYKYFSNKSERGIKQ